LVVTNIGTFGGVTLAMKNYITITEAAKILNVSKYYVYFLTKGRTRPNGKHEPPKFKKVLRFDKQHYTWYLLNKDEVTQYKRSKHNGTKQ
jgi:hypothetical protein